jgi:primosomal protein N' (replication factor Y)
MYITAKIAISKATYSMDKPFDYNVPQPLAGEVLPGVRVTVPFGRGNKRQEGMVISVLHSDTPRNLKSVESALDGEPILSAGQIKLALWIRDQYFCTFYDAARLLLPAGMWYKDGRPAVRDKVLSFIELDVSAEEAVALAAQKKMRAPKQAEILRFLAESGSADLKEILYFTGASRQSVKALEREGLLLTRYVEAFRRPEITVSEKSDEISLTSGQAEVFQSILELTAAGKASVALLHGVTGSGKTAIYISLVKELLKKGKTAIILVPEIALTPQLAGIFAAHFGDDIALLHSSLSVGERYDEWKRIKSGEVKVVIGTRSAIFAPISNLGIIIIDEEQENSYKSENNPRYHAREIAKYRCMQSGAVLLLGSATPSVESMYHARRGVYKTYTLMTRYNEMSLPDVIIADMKKELQRGNGSLIGAALRDELERNIKSGEQSILFINRRGASTFITCGECGHVFNCARCSVSMTYHSANRRFMCHYCGSSFPVRGDCPECGGKLNFVGAGTQKAEEELNAIFPGVGIIRMDTDTVSAKNSHEALLHRFSSEKIPILLGTQMVTKGLDFENVTLVGVLLADNMLYMNDYRAHERTFSLITQVVGRSGRGEKPGRAVIQTFTPQNEVIRLASKQDYNGFYEREIQIRELTGAPPVLDHFALSVVGADENAVISACHDLKKLLVKYFSGEKVLGPAPVMIAKVNNKYRYRVLLCTKNNKKAREIIAFIVREFLKNKRYKNLTINADTNPLT